MTLSGAEIRSKFVSFFKDKKGHLHLPSSSLIPDNPTLLLTSAGMVQFVPIFLGNAKPTSPPRAVTVQKCARAGGKDSDIENIGRTTRHHSFFEMLGNFSFGDYFKEDAIRFAWEFLTKVLGLPPARLWVTVFEDDDEAADIWIKKVGVDPARFSRMGVKDNFWSMGDTGPCGPCSEIFFDHGPDVAGGPPGSPDDDGDRYVEVWNLVFMQFDRSADGKMTPLPKPSVDTGMGLERIAAVMQGVHSNYQIDLFAKLISSTCRILGVENDGSSSLNVIADHIRACSFLIVDGVLPGNEGRGYVLRRIIRRAIRHGKKLGVSESFFYKLVKPLCDEMGDAYPELRKSRAHVEKVLKTEEERFAETLDQGMEILEAAIAGLNGRTLPGEVVFRLYDTYGFPVDLTADIARERSLGIDEKGFEKLMTAQRDRARAASKFGATSDDSIKSGAVSDFTGYDGIDGQSEIIAIFSEGQEVDTIAEGEIAALVLKSTPFYAESGGQVGDTGTIESAGARFEVSDTQKSGKAVLHFGKVASGGFDKGGRVIARVDAERRRATVLNHSATHLLHAALRKVLGDHVMQKGSLVAPDRLRFDFSHYEAVSPAQLQQIEDMVNDEIRKNTAAETRHMQYDDAVASGAIALFGEKYEDEVRVLRLGDFSVELCGGTHVSRSGDIGVFKIISEGGVASGVRRIEALTGKSALRWFDTNQRNLDAAATLLRSQRDQVVPKIEQLIRRGKELEKELAQARQQLLTGNASAGNENVVEIDGIKVLSSRMDGADAKTLRDAVDRFKDRLKSAVIVLGSVDDGKVRLAAGVTKNNVERIQAGDVIRPVAEQVGGKGGGRPDFAQAGGVNPEALDAALASVQAWVSEHLQQS